MVNITSKNWQNKFGEPYTVLANLIRQSTRTMAIKILIKWRCEIGELLNLFVEPNYLERVIAERQATSSIRQSANKTWSVGKFNYLANILSPFPLIKRTSNSIPLGLSGHKVPTHPRPGIYSLSSLAFNSHTFIDSRHSRKLIWSRGHAWVIPRSPKWGHREWRLLSVRPIRINRAWDGLSLDLSHRAKKTFGRVWRTGEEGQSWT